MTQQSSSIDALAELEQQFMHVIDAWNEDSSSPAAVSALQYALGSVRDAMHRSRVPTQDNAVNNDALVKVLTFYADTYCEGWCKDSPANATFDDCGGCKARSTLSNRHAQQQPDMRSALQLLGSLDRIADGFREVEPCRHNNDNLISDLKIELAGLREALTGTTSTVTSTTCGSPGHGG